MAAHLPAQPSGGPKAFSSTTLSTLVVLRGSYTDRTDRTTVAQLVDVALEPFRADKDVPRHHRPLFPDGLRDTISAEGLCAASSPSRTNADGLTCTTSTTNPVGMWRRWYPSPRGESLPLKPGHAQPSGDGSAPRGPAGYPPPVHGVPDREPACAYRSNIAPVYAVDLDHTPPLFQAVVLDGRWHVNPPTRFRRAPHEKLTTREVEMQRRRAWLRSLFTHLNDDDTLVDVVVAM